MGDPMRFDASKAALPPVSDTPAANDRDAAPEPSGSQVNSPAATPSEFGPAVVAENSLTGRALGAALAYAMRAEGYHPIFLIGTSNSGKTSLLLSLFAAIARNPSLQAGLRLQGPLLGPEVPEGRALHRDAEHTFRVKTLAFSRGEKIGATTATTPFFIPVEFRPANQPPVRLAFLEGNGEWFRSPLDFNKPIVEAERVDQDLREELEEIIRRFEGAMTFLYFMPYTQGEAYTEPGPAKNEASLALASLAVSNVLDAYDRFRLNYRDVDQHLMLVTKWDVRSHRVADRAGAIDEDRDALNTFVSDYYPDTLSKFQDVVGSGRGALNGYSSGIIDARGLQPPGPDDVKSAIAEYPIKLWKWLYGNALEAEGLARVSPFAEPAPQPALLRGWNRLLDLVSGR
jgi:hypothetical protein